MKLEETWPVTLQKQRIGDSGDGPKSASMDFKHILDDSIRDSRVCQTAWSIIISGR